MADDPVVGFVAPILWYLNRTQEEVPDQRAAPARLGYWFNAVRFVLLRDCLEKILVELRAAGVPAIVLKGVLLAETLFASPGLRAMSDLDLLVLREDFVQASQRLQQLGFVRRQGPLTELLDDWTARTKRKSKKEKEGRRSADGSLWSWLPGELSFYNLKGCAIDLHWHLVPSVWLRPYYRVNMDAVWQEAVPLAAHGLNGALGLSPVHTLAYLCLHIAQHGLQPPRWLLDIDQFVRQCHDYPSWNWERLVACAREWRIRSAAFHALYFSRYLFDTPVPERVLHGLDPGLTARARVAALIRPQDLLQYPPSALGRRYPKHVKSATVDRTTDLMKLLPRKFLLKYCGKHIWHVVTHGN